LGNLLLHLGRPEEALESYGNALRLRSDDLGVLLAMGAASRDIGNLDAAAAAFRRAVEIRPSAAELRYNLSVVLRLQNRNDDAMTACQKALELDATLVAAVVLLAKLHVDRGEFASAEALLERVISMDPDSPEAWSVFPSLRRMTSRDAAWLRAAQRIAAGPLPARQEAHLRYALGKYYDDVGEFGLAFVEYRRANELGRSLAPAHDRRRMEEFVEITMQTNFQEQAGPAHTFRTNTARQRPVFIIGMPRSGTSLAEQILASHPSVHGAGELPFWGNALRTALAAHGSGPPPLEQLARDYRALLARLAPRAACVIDKMPSNFLAAGLIRASLPDACIIHMQRNPVDTCLSIYFQDFESGYSYARDLEDLAHSYREYRRIMAHWRATLPAGAVLEVPYECLVRDQEVWTRRMLEFIGLPWDAACLNFHRTRRTVATVSSWQVRQALHASSVERWRNYRQFIGPLAKLHDDPE
jgi:tetratricopeptide (TPR) repeat protein